MTFLCDNVNKIIDQFHRPKKWEMGYRKCAKYLK